MIVVVGQPFLRETDQGTALEGAAARIAITAAERGRAVQLVGTAGEDGAGDQVVLALARAGVGHVALLRKAGQRTPLVSEAAADPLQEPPDLLDEPSERATVGGSPLDAGDVDLALRYLPDISVLVLAERTTSETVDVVAQAARWSDARLIVVLGDSTPPPGLPEDAIVFEAPSDDPDGEFARLVGSFAAALDEGDEPGDAFRATVAREGWAASES